MAVGRLLLLDGGGAGVHHGAALSGLGVGLAISPSEAEPELGKRRTVKIVLNCV